MTKKTDEFLGTGGRGANSAPSGFLPDSGTSVIDPSSMTFSLSGTSWGNSDATVGTSGRKLIAYALDGSQVIETAVDLTAGATTSVQMTLAGLKSSYAYLVRGYAQNQQGAEYRSPIMLGAQGDVWTITADAQTVSYRSFNKWSVIDWAVQDVGSDGVTCTLTAGANNEYSVYAKIYYVDVTDLSQPDFEFRSTDTYFLQGAGDSVDVAIAGLEPGHDYIFALRRSETEAGTYGNRDCKYTRFIRLPQVTQQTEASTTTETGWEPVYAELFFNEERKNVVTATRQNNTVTLDTIAKYRPAAFPTRSQGLDINLTGEGLYQRAYGQATEVKIASAYPFTTQREWLSLGTFSTDNPITTELSATATYTVNVGKDATQTSVGMGWDITSGTNSRWTAHPIAIAVPAAGAPAQPTFSNGDVTPTNTGCSISVQLNRTDWGVNCTGGTYALGGDLRTTWDEMGELGAVSLSYTDASEATAHTFTFDNSTSSNESLSNSLFYLHGKLTNDAGQSAQNAGTYGAYAITSPSAPSVSLLSNTNGTATFAFTGNSMGHIAPETYHWRLGEGDVWHPAGAVATGLTPGQTYTVQVKANIDVDTIDWHGAAPAEGALVFGGGDSQVVNGITFVADGEVVQSTPGIWVRSGLNNEKLSQIYVNDGGMKRRLSKIYANVNGENRLVFRDFLGAYNTVREPTIITVQPQSNDMTFTVSLSQTQGNGTVINWGDGTTAEVPEASDTPVTLSHTYTNGGEYNVVFSPLTTSYLEIKSISGCYPSLGYPIRLGRRVQALGDIVGAETNNSRALRPDLTYASDLVSIGRYAFKGAQFADTNIVLPQTVRSIGQYAFAGSNLTSIEIPDSCQEVLEYAFWGCPLTSAKLPSLVLNVSASCFGETTVHPTEVLHDQVRVISSYAFANLTTIDGQTIVMPAKLQELGEDVFTPLLSTAKYICDFRKCEQVPAITATSMPQVDKILVTQAMYGAFGTAPVWSNIANKLAIA